MSEMTLPALRQRWHYALSLEMVGVGLLIFGGLAEVLGRGLLPWVIGVVLLVAGAAFLVPSVGLFSSVRRGEERLRLAGRPWQVDRRLSGTARRTLTFGQPEYICVGQAYEGLQDGSLGLTDVERIRHGAVGIRPATLVGPLDAVVTGLPLGVKVRARPRGSQTELRVTVREVTLWRVFFLPTIQADFGWIEEAEVLADAAAAAISRRMA